MTLDEIVAFMAVVRLRSLSQAAESLGLTQPAITRRLQNLEESLGAQLLDRHTKPLSVTAIGQRAYDQCRVVMTDLEILRNLTTLDNAPKGDVHIGVVQTVADVALKESLAVLHRQFPQLTPRISTGWGPHLLERLDKGQLDAVVMLMPADQKPPDAWIARRFGRLQLTVVGKRSVGEPSAHSLADCQAAGWVLNTDGCGFRAGLQQRLKGLGLPIRINIETAGVELQLQLVASGAGYGLVPLILLRKSAYAEQLEALSIDGFEPFVDIWLLSSKSLGTLSTPVDCFGASVGELFERAQDKLLPSELERVRIA
ncbi:MAG: LysR family transcriptional regulator [Janthinobacterium lividum]